MLRWTEPSWLLHKALPCTPGTQCTSTLAFSLWVKLFFRLLHGCAEDGNEAPVAMKGALTVCTKGPRCCVGNFFLPSTSLMRPRPHHWCCSSQTNHHLNFCQESKITLIAFYSVYLYLMIMDNTSDDIFFRLGFSISPSFGKMPSWVSVYIACFKIEHAVHPVSPILWLVHRSDLIDSDPASWKETSPLIISKVFCASPTGVTQSQVSLPKDSYIS